MMKPKRLENTVRNVVAVCDCARAKAPRKRSSKSFAHTVHCLILTVLVTVGLTPFSATPSYAWAPDIEPVLSDGTYYIRPYLQAADGTWYEGTYSIGINDHGAAWGNDAITYSENNPIKINKTSVKTPAGRATYTLYDDGGWFGAFRRFTNTYGDCGNHHRLVGCSPEWDTLDAELFSFEFITQVATSSNKYIVTMYESTRGTPEKPSNKVSLEEGYTKNSKDCHLETVSGDVVFMWVLTKA